MTPTPANTSDRPADRRADRRAIAAWLFLSAAMIFAMVVIGGITRLTESGLSMVEWAPLLGWIPPLSEAEWQAVFAQYRLSPEYRHINAGMTLAEFKAIFWWEYIHRVWGRLIGVVFLVPFLWFALRGRLDRPLAWRLGAIFVLGGLQGGLGWFMVMSGLVDRPEVSQYRLTAHLGLAVVLYVAVLWTALGLVRRPGARRRGPLAGATAALAGLVFLTVLSGGFVAGLDAGLAYNTFPLMDGRLVPALYLDFEPAWRNLFENVAAVQFNHRALAVTTLVATLGLWLAARRRPLVPAARTALDLAAAMALIQVALGISTLLLYVPVALGALHQAGALVLLSLVTWAAFELRGRPAPAPASDEASRQDARPAL